LLIALSVTFFIKNGETATINANSCSQTAVQAAINSASAGDTVTIPAGTCTWTSQLTVSKGITIKGAGIDVTTIVANVATKAGDSGKLALVMDVSGATPWHLSDLTITDTGTYYDYEGVFKINGTCAGWRMNNVKFINTNARCMVIAGNSNSAPYTTYGVIDHCQFINSGGQSILIRPYSSTAANALWSQPTNLGAADAVFIEDCIFSNTAGEGHTAFDSEWGAKVVFRHNTLTNSFVLDHGYENNRSAIKLEIYDNTFNATVENKQPAITFRGGTGVVFNNTITSISYGYDYDLLVRDYCSKGTSNCFGGVQCTSYPCHDQVGRTSGPAYPNQTLQPLYVWNNTYNNSAFVVDIDASNNVIQKNRDYYEGGVTYNSGTDTYTHGATGFTYKPYEYPHPLRVPGSPQAPRLFIITTP
jgi:hypothetical protein